MERVLESILEVLGKQQQAATRRVAGALADQAPGKIFHQLVKS